MAIYLEWQDCMKRQLSIEQLPGKLARQFVQNEI